MAQGCKKEPDEALVQLATRVPRSLWRAVKLHGVLHGVTMQATVIAALREHMKAYDRTRPQAVP